MAVPLIDPAKYSMSVGDRKILEDQRGHIETEIQLAPVLDYLKAKGIFTAERIASLQKHSDSQVAAGEFLTTLQLRGPKAFESFCAALEQSAQFELLKRLRPDWQDGNCLGAIHKPTEEEIRKNDDFYSAEKRVYAGIPPTKGELDLKPFDSRDSVEIRSKFNEAEMYRNFSQPKGLALIINNREFYGPPGEPLPDRLGTDVDAKNSSKLWRNLGYDVKLVENLTGEKILKEMLRYSLDDHHEKCDSAVIIILSHGMQGGIYGVDGQLVPIDKLITCINATSCRALRGKPKLIILQACRGERYDSGHPGDHSDGKMDPLEDRSVESLLALLNDMDVTDAKNLQSKIPTEADILICYATTPGFVSWRNSARGSWFIQSICEIFAEFAHKKHVLDMLTMVNRRVAEVFTSSSGHKQIPEPSSRLTRDFWIFPGISQ